MDDLIFSEDDGAEIQRTRENLFVRFQMKELGELRHFLGLEIDNTKEGLFLYQEKYARDLLLKYGTFNCKPISTQIETNIKLCAREEKRSWRSDHVLTTSWKPYLSDHDKTTQCIRSWCCGVIICRNQRRLAWKQRDELCIVKYVKRTLDYGLVYKRGGECGMIDFSDAHYAGDHDTRRSTTGCIQSRVSSYLMV